MWLAWGSTSSVGELAIHKVIVHKANEDYIISINELGVVLNILLAMEVEELVTLRHSLLLLTSALDILLGGEHSRSKKRLKLGRACKEGRLVSLDSLCFSLLLGSISMLVQQYDKSNGKCHILFRHGCHI